MIKVITITGEVQTIRTQTNLCRLELWGLAVKHVHRFDAVFQHADCPVEHSHQVAEKKSKRVAKIVQPCGQT